MSVTPGSARGESPAGPRPGTDLEALANELWESGQWRRCFELLNEAQGHGGVPDALLQRHADLAFLLGREEECLSLSYAAYRRLLDSGQYRAAARVAFWTAFLLFNRGEPAQGAAWQARSRELVAGHGLGGAEEGALLGMDAHRAWLARQTERAWDLNERALAQAEAAGHRDGLALGRLLRGRIEFQQGRRSVAMASFDEAMASVSASETSPVVAGTVYCAVVGVCMRVRDLRRATEWTEALTAWCATRPDMVPYRGPCLVHRSQLHLMRGEWAAAVTEAERAIQLLADREVGEAYYHLGEVHRLTGAFEAAERDYRRANSYGHQPEPGLARLRITQGRPATAVTTLERLTRERRGAEDRADLLAALVSAQLAAGQVAAARGTVQQLTGITAGLDAPLLSALSAQALAEVSLAEGEAARALTAARRAWQGWRELELPHPAAQARVLAGRCLRALGDEEAAEMEFEAAREALTRLGAVPDLAALDTHAAPALPGGLTRREVEVIRLVAAGLSNRSIAERLFLSEKTVARHLSNIYAKLDLGSRAAATAWAFQHGVSAGG